MSSTTAWTQASSSPSLAAVILASTPVVPSPTPGTAQCGSSHVGHCPVSRKAVQCETGEEQVGQVGERRRSLMVRKGVGESGEKRWRVGFAE